MNSDEDVFKQFANSLQFSQPPSRMSADLLKLQAQQFARLNALEEEFRHLLLKDKKVATKVYQAFCNMFLTSEDEDAPIRKGLLTSRPYFRERQPVCAGPIGIAIRTNKPAELFPFHVNYNFVTFAMKVDGWRKTKAFTSTAKSIFSVRQQLIEQNSPLAIREARLFWRKAPVRMRDTRYTAMDFVQLGIEGLISAIDKFCLPSGGLKSPHQVKVWRAVAIGRMRGNFIEHFSSTNLHFFPPDRRKIYRAHKHIRHFTSTEGVVDFERLSWRVNQDLEADGFETTPQELSSLLGATSWVGDPIHNAYGGSNRPAPQTITESSSASEDWRPDVRFEQHQVRAKVKEIISRLDTCDRKILRLRGIDPEQIC